MGKLPVLDIIAVILAFVSLVVTILLTQHVRKHVPGELTDEGKGDDGEDGEDPKCVVHHYHIIHPPPTSMRDFSIRNFGNIIHRT